MRRTSRFPASPAIHPILSSGCASADPPCICWRFRPPSPTTGKTGRFDIFGFHVGLPSYWQEQPGAAEETAPGCWNYVPLGGARPTMYSREELGSQPMCTSSSRWQL